MTEIRLVTEKVEDPGRGYPWRVGYEVGSYTNLGWAAATPEHGFLRILNDELSRLKGSLKAAEEHAAVITALATEVGKIMGVRLEPIDNPIEYIRSGMFGSTRIEQVEHQRNEWQERLTDGHRCEHLRTCLDNCIQCPGQFSKGGPACPWDDKRFWANWPVSRR